ncbi:hypothetical protein [Chryseobacterium defluvii]|nr:hypothetical protein [Chryseobacterium defluvii]
MKNSFTSSSVLKIQHSKTRFIGPEHDRIRITEDWSSASKNVI